MSVRQTDSNQKHSALEEGTNLPLQEIERTIEEGLRKAKEGEIKDSNLSKKIAVQIVRSITNFYRGPVPPPAMLKEYHEIQADFPERLLRLTEEEARHRREMEKAVVQGEHKRISRAQWFAFISSLSAFGVASAALWLGNPAVAAIIMSTTVIGLAGVFVIGRYWTKTDKVVQEENAEGESE
ncbi:MAG: DUF2335 domain-containing protein [Candidatus Competibacteraceae bacterium]